MTRSYWKRKVKEMEYETMNAKQAARMAAKHIEELEHFNKLCSRDIKAYNIVIETLIAGGNPCPWCGDREDCAPSDQGHGCKEWFLKFDLTDEEVGSIAKDSEPGEGVSDGGGQGRETDSLIAGATGSLS